MSDVISIPACYVRFCHAIDRCGFLYFLCSYSLVLRHTTEEVLDACIEAMEPSRAALTSHLRNQVMNDLLEGLKKQSWFSGFDIEDEFPVKYPLEQWIMHAKELRATVFIAGSTFVASLHLNTCTNGCLANLCVIERMRRQLVF